MGHRIDELLQVRLGRVGFAGLLPEERTCHLLRALNLQVNSGSFEQYLDNSSGDFADETAAALERLGCSRLSQAVRSAMELIPGGWCQDRNERMNRMFKLLPEDDDGDDAEPFRSVTTEYHEARQAEAALVSRAWAELEAAYARAGLLL